MKVCYEVYSFELNLLIIHLRNYEAFFCFKLIFTKEYWNLVSYLTFKNWKYRTRTSNRIFHESKNPINNRTRTTFSINRLVPLYLLDECAKTFFFLWETFVFQQVFSFCFILYRTLLSNITIELSCQNGTNRHFLHSVF